MKRQQKNREKRKNSESIDNIKPDSTFPSKHLIIENVQKMQIIFHSSQNLIVYMFEYICIGYLQFDKQVCLVA